MQNTAIFYPTVAMFTLSIGLIFFLGIKRFLAIQQGKVRISYYKTYNKGEQTERLHLLGRHIQNHFEVPPMFYAGVVISYLIGATDTMSIMLAWGFVAARTVHSCIHLGSNNVSQRFFVFGLSLLCLTGLWLKIFLSLLNTGATGF